MSRPPLKNDGHPPHLFGQLLRYHRRVDEAFRRAYRLNERKVWRPAFTCFKGEWDGAHERAKRQTAQWSRKNSKRCREQCHWFNLANELAQRLCRAKREMAIGPGR